jgi:hypothetical protein
MLRVNWVKCGDDHHYCNLELLKLDKLSTTGVYIIWHEGQPGRVVRIGQGEISDRLAVHRQDARVLAYKKYGALRVTWAAVPAHLMDSVELYLANEWHPLLGDAFPDVTPLAVNSPFAA